MSPEVEKSTPLHPGLGYQATDDDEAVGVPRWGHLLAKTGSWVGGLEPPRKHSVTVSIVLPCRPFAAAFAAAGIVVGRTLDASHRMSAEAHFRALAELPAGTPLFWRHGDRVLKGILQGTARHTETDFLRVQVGNTAGGRKTRLIREDNAMSVRVADHAGNLPMQQKGRKISGVTPFLHATLGDHSSLLIERDRCDCLIIGRRSTLREELLDSRFFVDSEAERIFGNLNDFIRARPLVSSTSTHRAQIRTHGQGLPESVNAPEPPVVVFDGALAFLKSRLARSRRHSVVLLDRFEPRFQDAVDVLRGVFHERGVPVNLQETPLKEHVPGLELLAFSDDYVGFPAGC